jgi:glycine cleavage system aminomethyltransferase T
VGTVEENPGILLYTRIRRSPYFFSSRKHGVKRYSVYNHFYHPRHYGNPVDEYWHLLNEVTMWDVGVERQIEISGPDAFTFTNMLVPRDLTKCRVGQCKYVFITAPDGGIINDPVLLRPEEKVFRLSLADSDVDLWAMGVAYHSGLDVTIREVDIAPVQIQGPKAKEVIGDLFGPEVPEIPYYDMALGLTLNGMDVEVSRTGYSGEIGFEIYLHNARRDAEKLWNTVLEAGTRHNLRVIGPCHIRRIEAGILAYGADMWLDNNPFEVGLGYGWMVDLDQESDFVGKDALRRIKDEGVKQKLVGVDIEGASLGSYIDNEMVDFFPVYADGREVGRVTSACYSPRLEKNIGYAMLPVEFETLGTELEVDHPRSGRVRAAVSPKPAFDPSKEIPKR